MESIGITRRKIVRFDEEGMRETEDEIAREYVLTVWVNDVEMMTTVCTPDHLEELVVGLLASEGIIGNLADIRDLAIDKDKGYAHVATGGNLPFDPAMLSKRYMASCCGKSRQMYYYWSDARTAKKVVTTVRLSIREVFRIMRRMQEQSSLFRQTGGVHNAALCDAEGIIAVRSDIGRHNALDKLYGYCWQQRLETSDKLIAFSGRISSEVLLKASKMGVGVMLSKSAPTELALDLAEQLGITVVGFVRGQSCNIYTCPERIAEYRR